MPLNFSKLSVDSKGLEQRKKSTPRDSNFFTEGIHPVKVKQVEKKTSAKGNSYFFVSFYSGNKSLNMFVFLPDGSKKYNPSSPTNMNLEALLNHTLNMNINPNSSNYLESLIKGLEMFDTPSVFEEKECKIQVGYPGTHVQWTNGKFFLVDKKGEPFLGDKTEYPTRDAAYAAFEQVNSKRSEPIKLFKFPEVLKVLAPDTPNKVDKVIKKDALLEESPENDSDSDEDVGF